MLRAGIQREEEKAKRQIKDSVKKGNKEAALILAKEVLNSRKAIARLYSAKAQMKSVEYNMNNQLGELAVYSLFLRSVAFLCSANIRLAGNLEKSTEVMKSMSELVKIKDVSANMRDLSREMMKVRLITLIFKFSHKFLKQNKFSLTQIYKFFLSFSYLIISHLSKGWNYGRDDGRRDVST